MHSGEWRASVWLTWHEALLQDATVVCHVACTTGCSNDGLNILILLVVLGSECAGRSEEQRRGCLQVLQSAEWKATSWLLLQDATVVGYVACTTGCRGSSSVGLDVVAVRFAAYDVGSDALFRAEIRAAVHFLEACCESTASVNLCYRLQHYW
jgi:hypothetical protein